MARLDWVIVASVYLVLVGGVVLSKRYMRSVADFLAAGRSAGRYLISVSAGIAGVGAITIVGNLEMNLEAGFAMSWWGMSMTLVVLLVAVSGWVIYRFRSTRCLTLAEFFERRYSRSFRITAGIVAFLAGILNFGIFPQVGARFFIAFFGLPASFPLLGFEVGTFPLLMALLLTSALAFVYTGGQVTVILTDFLQGLFANVVFVAIPLYLLFFVGWDRIGAVLADQPPGRSLINPFDTGHIENFNFGYFLIGVFGVLLRGLGWQGEQAYNVSATSAHEAKMAGVLAMWRGFPMGLLLVLVPIVGATIMQHVDFAPTAAAVGAQLDAVGMESVRSQLATPLILAQVLPVGLMGMFGAMMLAAFISTHDTYLHSWGSIFIQDVFLPLRGGEIERREHLKILRWAILGVAVFIFAFSLVWIPSNKILMYFALTGSIFANWAGIVTIGGLYTKWGTASGAWAALVLGTATATLGMVFDQWVPSFPLNGQEFWALGMAVSILAYVVFSLLERKSFNLDRLLHRGAYAVADERIIVHAKPKLIWRLLGMGQEFTRRDRVLYVATYLWTGLNVLVFIVGTVVNVVASEDFLPDGAWLIYWKIWVTANATIAVVVIVWFGFGGIRDARRMLKHLATAQRDDEDDGVVRS